MLCTAGEGDAVSTSSGSSGRCREAHSLEPVPVGVKVLCSQVTSSPADPNTVEIVDEAEPRTGRLWKRFVTSGIFLGDTSHREEQCEDTAPFLKEKSTL